jgi:hypothetical protein
MFGLFGQGKKKDKGKVQAPADGSRQERLPPHLATPRMEVMANLADLPWPDPRPSVAANYAYINLRDQLLEIHNLDQKGVHLETLMVSIGALAGFTAAFAASKVESGDFRIANGADGKRYIFSDAANSFLFGEGGRRLNVWSLVSGGAMAAGCPVERLPDTVEIVRHVASSVGGDGFGPVRAPEDHRPGMLPVDALRALWKRTAQILGFKEHVGAEGKPLEFEHWPTICAAVAQEYILMGKDKLDPALAAKLVIESAVIASKTDPAELA